MNSIPAIIKRLEPNKAVTEALVFAAWDQAAGEQIGLRTKPLTFIGKRLIVAVEDETWRHNLEGFAPQLLVELNKLLGQDTVTFLEFRVADLEP